MDTSACDNHKRVEVCDSRPLFRWIQSIIILILKINENQTEFGNRRLSDNTDHLFQSQMEHSFAKPNEHASYSHASLTISQSKWIDKSAAGAPDLTCIGFEKISKDLLWRSNYGWGGWVADSSGIREWVPRFFRNKSSMADADCGDEAGTTADHLIIAAWTRKG